MTERATTWYSFAYADPPYLGCARKHYGDHPDAAVYDTVEGHAALIDRLMAEYPDGWALSMNPGNLRDLLPLVPSSARVCSWSKPFVRFKRGVRVANTWEPVILHGGRRWDKTALTVRDSVSIPIAMGRGLTGSKPEEFCHWVLDLLGWAPGDELDDLFPGTGVMGRVVAAARGRLDGVA